MEADSPCMCWSSLSRSPCLRVLPGVLLTLFAGGCIDPSLEDPNASQELGRLDSPLDGENGLGTNGLGTNGLGTNGLGTNGLGTSGLSTSGMDSGTFVDWFNQHPDTSNVIMQYVVTCALAPGSALTWTNPVTGTPYSWTGRLGLTPGWAGGAPATELEQQLITACLAAHTNKYGLHVPISLQGLNASGVPIPVGDQEFATYAQREACFFGNLFQNEGIFAANDALLPDANSSVRACGMGASGAGDQCAPIHHMNSCSGICVPDAMNNYYVSCTYQGKSYRAITTRIQPRDVYACGDGVCQLSESCGTGLTPNNCMDCGPCP